MKLIYIYNNYYTNICLIFCSVQSDDKFGHDEYDTYIKKYHPKIYTFDELLIKEDNKMKENFKDYKQVKSISGKDIVNNACQEEFEKFVKHFGFHNEIKFNEINFNWIRDNIENGIQFGIDNGFIEKVEKYNENKLYFCSYNNYNHVGKLVRINGKFIWVGVNNISNSLFSSEWCGTIEESIKSIKSLGWNVNSFDTFEEAMEYYFPAKNKIDMSKTDKLNILYDLSKEFKIDIVCESINSADCLGVICKDCKFNG